MRKSPQGGDLMPFGYDPAARLVTCNGFFGWTFGQLACVKIRLAGGKFWSPMFAPINGNEAFEFHAGIVAATTSENLIGRLDRAI